MKSLDQSSTSTNGEESIARSEASKAEYRKQRWASSSSNDIIVAIEKVIQAKEEKEAITEDKATLGENTMDENNEPEACMTNGETDLKNHENHDDAEDEGNESLRDIDGYSNKGGTEKGKDTDVVENLEDPDRQGKTEGSCPFQFSDFVEQPNRPDSPNLSIGQNLVLHYDYLLFLFFVFSIFLCF